MNKYRKDLEELIEKNLKIYTKKVGRKKMFYLPDTDEWVYRFSKLVVKRTGYTQRYWYNKYILGIDDKNYSPKCCKASCNNKVKAFKGTKYGYPKYCCLKHAREDEDTKDERSKSIKKAMNRPEVLEKKSKSLKEALSNPEYRKNLSERSKRQWQDPEYREKNLHKIPRSKSCVSKVSIECLNGIHEIFSTFGFGSTVHYGNGLERPEFRVKVKSISTGKIAYRYLDFFSEELRLIIEFNGDYWHPRKEKFGIEKVNNSVKKDTDRMKEIYDSLKVIYGSDIYLINIYENEYRRDKSMILNDIESILSKFLETRSLSDSGNLRLINLRDWIK